MVLRLPLVPAAATIVAHTENIGVLGQVCSLAFAETLPVYEAAGLVVITGTASSDGLAAFGPTVSIARSLPMVTAGWRGMRRPESCAR